MKKKSATHELFQKIDTLSFRERCILLGACFMLITLSCIQFGLEPLLKEIQQRSANIQAKQLKHQEVETELKIIQLEYRIDPNQALYQQQAQLEKALQGIEKQLDAIMYSLVTPQKMVQVIRDLFSTQENIALIRMETLPPQSVFFTRQTMSSVTTEDAASTEPPETTRAATATETQTLYQHGVKLVFEADFFTVLDYLKQLEQLKWRFYWHELNYEVTEHPIAAVSLEIHTFSQEAGVLGV